MALMDILGPAASVLRSAMEAERAGKKEEADRLYRETEQALSALTTVTGVKSQQERLGLLRSQQQLAERMAPSQIRGAEAGARLAETRATEAESALERQQGVSEAVDELLRAEGEPVPYEAILKLREVLEGRAGIEELREARRLGAPAAEAGARVGEARRREAVAGREEREAEVAVQRGLPEATVEAALEQRARDEAVALMDVRLLNEAEREQVMRVELLAKQVDAAGLANQAAQMKVAEQERLNQLLTDRGIDPDDASVQSFMIVNKLWETPEWYREQMRGILTTQTSILQRASIDEVRQDVAATGATPDSMAFFMGAMAGAGGVGGALSPEGKRDALTRLKRWYTALRTAAAAKYPTEEWGPEELGVGALSAEQEEALADEARRRRQAGGR